MYSRTNCSIRSSKVPVLVFSLMHRASHLSTTSATQGLNGYNQAFGGLTTRMTSSLQTGQMWFWSKNWIMMNWENDGVDFHGHLILMEVRPRAAQHGGATKQYGAGDT